MSQGCYPNSASHRLVGSNDIPVITVTLYCIDLQKYIPLNFSCILPSA